MHGSVPSNFGGYYYRQFVEQEANDYSQIHSHPPNQYLAYSQPTGIQYPVFTHSNPVPAASLPIPSHSDKPTRPAKSSVPRLLDGSFESKSSHPPLYPPAHNRMPQVSGAESALNRLVQSTHELQLAAGASGRQLQGWPDNAVRTSPGIAQPVQREQYPPQAGYPSTNFRQFSPPHPSNVEGQVYYSQIDAYPPLEQEVVDHQFAQLALQQGFLYQAQQQLQQAKQAQPFPVAASSSQQPAPTQSGYFPAAASQSRTAPYSKPSSGGPPESYSANAHPGGAPLHPSLSGIYSHGWGASDVPPAAATTIGQPRSRAGSIADQTDQLAAPSSPPMANAAASSVTAAAATPPPQVSFPSGSLPSGSLPSTSSTVTLDSSALTKSALQSPPPVAFQSHPLSESQSPTRFPALSRITQETVESAERLAVSLSVRRGLPAVQEHWRVLEEAIRQNKDQEKRASEQESVAARAAERLSEREQAVAPAPATADAADPRGSVSASPTPRASVSFAPGTHYYHQESWGGSPVQPVSPAPASGTGASVAAPVVEGFAVGSSVDGVMENRVSNVPPVATSSTGSIVPPNADVPSGPSLQDVEAHYQNLVATLQREFSNQQQMYTQQIQQMQEIYTKQVQTVAAQLSIPSSQTVQSSQSSTQSPAQVSSSPTPPSTHPPHPHHQQHPLFFYSQPPVPQPVPQPQTQSKRAPSPPTQYPPAPFSPLHSHVPFPMSEPTAVAAHAATPVTAQVSSYSTSPSTSGAALDGRAAFLAVLQSDRSEKDSDRLFTRYRETMQRLEHELQQLRREKETLQEKHALQTQEFEEREYKLYEEREMKEVLEEEKRQWEAERSSLNSVLATRSEEMKKLQQTTQFLQKELEDVLSESERLTGALKKLEKHKLTREKKLQEVQKELMARETAYLELQKSLLQEKASDDSAEKDLQFRIRTLEGTLLKMQKERELMAQEKSELEESLRTRTDEMEAAQTQRSQLVTELASVQNALLSSKRRIEQLELNLSAKEMGDSDLQKQVQELTQTNADQSTRIHSKDAEIQQLTSQLSQLRDELSSLQAGHSQKDNELRTLQSDLSSHKGILESLRRANERIPTLESELAAFRTREQGTTIRISQLEGIVRLLETQKSELGLKNAEQSAKIDDLEHKYRESESFWKTKLESAETSLLHAKLQMEQFESEHAAMESSLRLENKAQAELVKQLRQEAEEIGDAKLQLQLRLEQLEALQSSREAEWNQQRSDAENQIQELKEKRESLQQQITTLQAQLKSAEEEKEDTLRVFKTNTQALEKNMERKEREHRSQQQKMEKVVRELSDVVQQQNEALQALQSQLEESETKHKETVAAFEAQKSEEAEALQHEVREQNRQISELQSELQAWKRAEEAEEHYKQEIRELQERVAETQEEMDRSRRKEEEWKALQSQFEKDASKIEELTRDFVTLREEHAELIRKYSEECNERAELERIVQKHAQERQAWEQWEDEKENLIAQLEESITTMGMLTDKISSLQNEKKQMEQALRNIQTKATSSPLAPTTPSTPAVQNTAITSTLSGVRGISTPVEAKDQSMTSPHHRILYSPITPDTLEKQRPETHGTGRIPSTTTFSTATATLTTKTFPPESNASPVSKASPDSLTRSLTQSPADYASPSLATSRSLTPVSTPGASPGPASASLATANAAGPSGAISPIPRDRSESPSFSLSPSNSPPAPGPSSVHDSNRVAVTEDTEDTEEPTGAELAVRQEGEDARPVQVTQHVITKSMRAGQEEFSTKAPGEPVASTESETKSSKPVPDVSKPLNDSQPLTLEALASSQIQRFTGDKEVSASTKPSVPLDRMSLSLPPLPTATSATPATSTPTATTGPASSSAATFTPSAASTSSSLSESRILADKLNARALDAIELGRAALEMGIEEDLAMELLIAVQESSDPVPPSRSSAPFSAPFSRSQPLAQSLLHPLARPLVPASPPSASTASSTASSSVSARALRATAAADHPPVHSPLSMLYSAPMAVSPTGQVASVYDRLAATAPPKTISREPGSRDVASVSAAKDPMSSRGSTPSLGQWLDGASVRKVFDSATRTTDFSLDAADSEDEWEASALNRSRAVEEVLGVRRGSSGSMHLNSSIDGSDQWDSLDHPQKLKRKSVVFVDHGILPPEQHVSVRLGSTAPITVTNVESVPKNLIAKTRESGTEESIRASAGRSSLPIHRHRLQQGDALARTKRHS